LSEKVSLISKLLDFLENNQNYNENDFQYLISNSMTSKIVKNILDGNLEKISPEDFENIKKDGNFLLKCGNRLQIYGINNQNENFLNFSIKLIKTSRKYLTKFSDDYGQSLLIEGTSYFHLGLFGYSSDLLNNFHISIKLFEKSRKYGLKKENPEYGYSLLNEGLARVEIAKLINEPNDNLKKAINLTKDSRKYFKEGTLNYTKSLTAESTARLKFALRSEGITEKTISIQKVIKSDPEREKNINIVIHLCEDALSYGFPENHPDYGNSLINEFLALTSLEFEDEKKLIKIAKIGELLRKDVFESYNSDQEIFLTSEADARIKLFRSGIEPLENLEKGIKILEIANNVVEIKNPHYKLNLTREIELREITSENVKNEDNLRKLIKLYEKIRIEFSNKNSKDFINLAIKEFQIISKLLIITLSAKDLKNAIKFYKKSRKDIFSEGSPEYLSSLNSEAIALQKLVEMGFCSIEESITNLKRSIILCGKIRKYNNNDTPLYLISLLEEGSSLSKLASLEKNPIASLKKAICLFELARFGFKKDTEDFGYALTLMNEANTRKILAELKIDPISNLKKAITLSKDAREAGLKKGSQYYASTMINQAAATLELAQYGHIGNQIEALTIIKELFKGHLNDFKKGSIGYAKALIEEGKVVTKLTEFGVVSIEELNKIVEMFAEARSIVGTNTPEYVASLVEEGLTLYTIADRQIDNFEVIASLNKSITLFQESRENGLLKDGTYYPASLIYEGTSRVKLASLGIQRKQNLIAAINLYKQAKSEDIVKYASVTHESLNYGRILLIEGNAKEELAKINVKAESNISEAISLYQEAKDFLQKYNDRIGLIMAYTHLGELYYSQQKFEDAYNNLKGAIELVEDTRSSIKIPEIRKEYFKAFIRAYNSITFTCIALGKSIEAFKYAEASKGRVFLELLSNGKKKIKGDKSLIKEYKNISNQINKIDLEIDELQIKFSQGEEINHNYFKDLHSKLDKLIEKQNILLLKIKKNDPEYYDIETLPPIDIGKLDLQGKTLVEYVLDRKLVIFVLNNNDLIVEEVEIDESEFLKNFILFRKIVEQGNDIHEGDNLLNYFYKLLINPIKNHLKDEIVIIPDKYLSAIPFQALKGSKYLIEDYKISFAQSAASLKFLNSGTGLGALVVGNPTSDLPYSESEAIEVAKILKTTPLIQNEAKKNIILKEIPNKKIIHIACHGSFNLSNPSLSRLKLSDGSIRINDLMAININGDLMVLSACDSGLSAINHADEFEGLIRAIQLGGCRFVIASLWPVLDKSTKELFSNFYNGKGDCIEKLRNAELELMKKYKFDKWAAFQVYGV
jgi:CHAT domain-containing protein